MSGEMQFDSSLGGSEKLRHRVNIKRFAAARAKEIKAMKQALQSPSNTKLAFQRLPKYMRRRVMSHNAKRLPRRLREIYIQQMQKSGVPPKQKRPSRKYRRRPRNLLTDYVRRQKNHVWLETHIWHAKRFHMIDKWGYRLPKESCEKGFRAAYRASTKYCLIHDLSYFNCIEISGPLDILKKSFMDFSDSKVGLGICAKAFLNGSREGQVILCNPKNKKAIGTVYFNWKPVDMEDCVLVRTLWLWIHPGYYTETLGVFVDCLDLKTSDASLGLYKNDLKIELKELKNDLCRFRLTGPLSLPVLFAALKIVNVHNSSSWFKTYMEKPSNLEMFTNQCEYWKSIESLSSSELPFHFVFSLIVDDPRINLPKSRSFVNHNSSLAIQSGDVQKNIASGPIWIGEIRNHVKENKTSNAQLAMVRSRLLLPGSDVEESREALPILIIQRIGNAKLGGCDLIVPSGWGNTFWISLIMWGARPGGLREFNSLRFEGGESPFLSPDTETGRREDEETSRAFQQLYFRLPPNKRVNYTKFGMVEPFNFNWNLLVDNWTSSPANDFFVLRHKEMLVQIQNLLSKNIKASSIDYNLKCIVPVRLKMDKSGNVKQFARIYLPKTSDFANKLPVEELKEDFNEKIRKTMRLAHKNLLKRWRRRRKAGKKVSNDEEIVEEYRQEMRKLWLPQLQNDNLRTSCSRELIGFVTNGNFSFVQAHSCAIGYIAMGAVQALELSVKRNKVLVRNISSRQYRLATLEIIL